MRQMLIATWDCEIKVHEDASNWIYDNADVRPVIDILSGSLIHAGS